MKYNKAMTIAFSSILALALLSGCDQKGDTAKDMSRKAEAAVVDKVETGSNTITETAEDMSEDAEKKISEKYDDISE